MPTQNVWPVNELGELVLSQGYGSATIAGFVNQDLLPSDNLRRVPVVGFGDSYKTKVLREITDLDSVTNAATGGTVVSSIDTASPFGGSALKLEFGAGVTQHDVTITGFSLPNHIANSTSGKIVFKLYFSDPRHVTQIQTFVGTTSLSRYRQFNYKTAATAESLAQGVHMFSVTAANATTDTLLTSDTVNTVRLRFQRSTSASSGTAIINAGDTPAATPTTVWVKGVYLPDDAYKPFVVLTFDDASRSWMTILHPILKARGLFGTFAINKGDVGTNDNLFINTTDMVTLAKYGHDLSCHNVTDTAFSPATKASYISEFRTGRDWMRSLGVLTRPDYHPYVQGKHNQDIINALNGEGVKYHRVVRAENMEPLSFTSQTCQMPTLSWGSGTSLDAAKLRVQAAQKNIEDVICMGHEFAATDSSSVTWASAKTEQFLDYCLAEVAAGRLAGVGSLSQYLRYRGITS